jgi:metal-responsive CopG/Arc/MetJ family transcriptional regulator
MKKEKKKRLTIDIKPQFHNRLSRMEELTGTSSKSELIRESLRVYEYLIKKISEGYTFQAIKEEKDKKYIENINLIIPVDY